MKVLLVNPPNIHQITTNVPEYVSDSAGHLPPLGLLYIASSILRNNKHKITIIDALVENATYDEIAVKTFDYDIVGITTMTFFLYDVVKTIEAIRKHNTKIKIVLGGPHIAIFAEESLEIPGVNFCLKGECDTTFLQLVDLLENGGELESVPGLYWKDELGNIRNNCVGDYIDDLDALPFPERSLLDYQKYSSILSRESPNQGYVTTAFSSRGCPYKCIFCDRPNLGKKFRAHSAKYVVSEIKQCTDMGINEIFFYDDTFTIDKDRVYEICNLILEWGLDFTWDIRARVNDVDFDMLNIMKRAGCSRIHLGVEAASPQMMRKLKKGITKELAIQAFADAKRNGLETLGYFMFGCPDETLAQMQETIEFALKLNPDYAHFSILTPFPGTPIYLDSLRLGLFDRDYWREYSKNPTLDFQPKFLPNTLPREQLLSILKKSYKTFYMRPKYIMSQAFKVRSAKSFIKKVKVAKRIFFG